MKILLYFLFLGITLLLPLSFLAFGSIGNIVYQLIFFAAVAGYLYLLYMVIKKRNK